MAATEKSAPSCNVVEIFATRRQPTRERGYVHNIIQLLIPSLFQPNVIDQWNLLRSALPHAVEV
jgi:hypothetical protein